MRGMIPAFAKTTRVALLCAAIASVSRGPVAADNPPPNVNWDNPFCAAVGRLVPWDRQRSVPVDGPSDEYALFLWSNALSTFSVKMTMVDSSSAFTVDIPKVTIPKDKIGHNLRWPWLINFDHSVSILAEFVDAVSIDGQPMRDCPSFVQTVDPFKQWSMSTVPARSDFESVGARFLQKLPPLPCGKIFTAATGTGYSPLVGHFGDRPRATDIEVFIDSAGTVVDTRIWSSSGVDGLDEAARGAAQISTYKPAVFLCTPVVSYGIFRFEYQP